jgi:hypothetical protein
VEFLETLELCLFVGLPFSTLSNVCVELGSSASTILRLIHQLNISHSQEEPLLSLNRRISFLPAFISLLVLLKLLELRLDLFGQNTIVLFNLKAFLLDALERLETLGLVQ